MQYNIVMVWDERLSKLIINWLLLPIHDQTALQTVSENWLWISLLEIVRYHFLPILIYIVPIKS